MKPLTAKQVMRVLGKHGFFLSRQRGSHVIFRSEATGKSVPVPLHGRNRPIPLGIFRAIVKQSGIPQNEFAKR